MFIAIDIGNTNIVLGLYKSKKPLDVMRLKTDQDRETEEYSLYFRDFLRVHGVTAKETVGVCGASVVPRLMQVWTQVVKQCLHQNVFWVDASTRTGVKIKVRKPRLIGADRLVNVAAVWKLYGGPAIVVDMGTATTFDVLSAKGEFLGGAIAPGVYLGAEALYLRTAKLPRVKVARPAQAIGRFTEQSMQSGLYFGVLGQVQGILQAIKAEIKTKPRVIGTGGLAFLLQKEKVFDIINPVLTLEGLRIIHEQQ